MFYTGKMKTKFATCPSKFELKVASCVEQTPNQYWNIAPQHCRVPIKRTSSVTVTGEFQETLPQGISIIVLVPENIHTLHRRRGWKFQRGWRVLQQCMKLNWGFQRGGRGHKANPFHGGMDIFWNYQYTLLIYSVCLLQVNFLNSVISNNLICDTVPCI